MSYFLPDLDSQIVWRYWPMILGVSIFPIFLLYSLTPPANLRHLPRAPIIPLLISYLSSEVEDQRIKRILVPFANEKKVGAVLVYALGRWVLHVFDRKLVREVTNDVSTWGKETPHGDMILWKFIGKKGIVVVNGEEWKKAQRFVKAALDRNVPVEAFVELSKKVFHILGDGGRHRWDDLTTRFTLDAVGNTALGYDFNSLEDPHGAFVVQYNAVMYDISHPVHYVAFPQLERWLPRKKTLAQIEAMVNKLTDILEYKKHNKGNDMITYMLEEPGMTDVELRDNMVLFFIAGHDTTAGAISSVVYYLAKFPEYQTRVREEVLRALRGAEPTVENMREMPFTQACIRESMRANSSTTTAFPRTAQKDITLRDSNNRAYFIPANTSVVVNLTAMHYNVSNWPNPKVYDPSRFFKDGKEENPDTTIWVPFLRGPRQCPARNFAMYEVRTLLSMLVREYEFSLPADTIHADMPQNCFSSFALNSPRKMDIIFRKIGNPIRG